MKLSDHHVLVVEQKKLKEYLLNFGHDDGAPKARFFLTLGYGESTWRDLAETLREHAARNEVFQTVESSFGKKYIVKGPIRTFDGFIREPGIFSVWIVERDSSEARLVTAYPVG